MSGGKKRKSKGSIFWTVCFTMLLVRTFWTVQAAEEMEMGGFEVEIGVGEQQEIPEDFKFDEETPTAKPPAEEAPPEEVPTGEVISDGTQAHTNHPQSTVRQYDRIFRWSDQNTRC